jgi:hypothetical protein
VERGRPTAIGPLPREAPVIHAGAVTKQRDDVVGVVSPTLISGAGEPDPRSRSIDTGPGAREQRRELGMENPAPAPIDAALAPCAMSVATIAKSSRAAAARTARPPAKTGSFACDGATLAAAVF